MQQALQEEEEKARRRATVVKVLQTAGIDTTKKQVCLCLCVCLGVVRNALPRRVCYSPDVQRVEAALAMSPAELELYVMEKRQKMEDSLRRKAQEQLEEIDFGIRAFRRQDRKLRLDNVKAQKDQSVVDGAHFDNRMAFLHAMQEVDAAYVQTAIRVLTPIADQAKEFATAVTARQEQAAASRLVCRVIPRIPPDVS